MASRPTTPPSRASWLRYSAEFDGLALALTWAPWTLLVLASRGVHISGGQAWHLYGSLGPAIAGTLMTLRLRGASGVGELYGRCIRAPGRGLAVAIGGPLGLLFIGLVARRLLVGTWPDIATLGRSAEFPELAPPLYALASVVFFGFGEEIGWRGFLLPHLEARMKPRHAALAFAPFWALWHAPLFLASTQLARMGGPAVIGWVLSLAVGSVLLTWLHAFSRASVLAVALLHGLLDVAFLVPDATGRTANLTGMLVTLWGLALLFLRPPWGLRDGPRGRGSGAGRRSFLPLRST